MAQTDKLRKRGLFTIFTSERVQGTAKSANFADIFCFEIWKRLAEFKTKSAFSAFQFLNFQSLKNSCEFR